MSSIIIRAPKIALLSGSLRQGSFNTQLIGAAKNVADQLGAETRLINLADYDLPTYNQDTEASSGIPESAFALKAALGETDAWIVASPEYNGFPSPLLVNAYTWCSRGDNDGAMYATFAGKTALVLGASPGAMGGLRAIGPHRNLLQNLGLNVLSNSVAIGGAFKAFSTEDTGSGTGNVQLVDEKQQGMLHAAVESLFLKARDEANRDASCGLIERHLAGAGDFGAVSTPESA